VTVAVTATVTVVAVVAVWAVWAVAVWWAVAVCAVYPTDDPVAPTGQLDVVVVVVAPTDVTVSGRHGD
jgi:hypothetical protein